MTVEELAKELHEAGREAVIAGQTVAATKFGEPARTFMEWEEISDKAKEGRRIQAKYLLERFSIVKHQQILCWMVERTDMNQPMYYRIVNGISSFTSNVEQGMKFFDQESATRMAEKIYQLCPVQATEHMFYGEKEPK